MTLRRRDRAAAAEKRERARQRALDRLQLEIRGEPDRTKLDRQARAFRRAFHSKEFVAWVKSQPCSVPRCGDRTIDAAHIKSRGAGGTWRDIVPLCSAHHRELHRIGLDTFAQRVGVDLRDVSQGQALRNAIQAARLSATVAPSTPNQGAFDV